MIGWVGELGDRVERGIEDYCTCTAAMGGVGLIMIMIHLMRSVNITRKVVRCKTLLFLSSLS